VAWARRVLDVAQEIGAISASRADELEDQWWQALAGVGQGQAIQVESQRPTRRFLSVLQTLVTQRRVLILEKRKSPMT
jgi:hypothetical protein